MFSYFFGNLIKYLTKSKEPCQSPIADYRSDNASLLRKGFKFLGNLRLRRSLLVEIKIL